MVEEFGPEYPGFNGVVSDEDLKRDRNIAETTITSREEYARIFADLVRSMQSQPVGVEGEIEYNLNNLPHMRQLELVSYAVAAGYPISSVTENAFVVSYKRVVPDVKTPLIKQREINAFDNIAGEPDVPLIVAGRTRVQGYNLTGRNVKDKRDIPFLAQNAGLQVPINANNMLVVKRPVIKT